MFTVDSEEEEEDVTEDAAVAEDEATTTTAPEVEEAPEYCGQVLCCTVLYYNIVLYSTVLYSTVLCTLLYCTLLYSNLLYCGQAASNLTLEEAVSSLVRNPSLSIFADILRRAENVTDTIRYQHFSFEY